MKQATLVKALLLATSLTAIAAAGVSADAQNLMKRQLGGRTAQAHIGMVQDWSHRSVIFTKAKTFDETVAAHLSQPRWDRMVQDPRYVMALTRRFQSEGGAPLHQTIRDSRRGHPTTPNPSDVESAISRDWSNVLGGGADGLGGKGIEGVFPAKYQFDLGATPSCVNDFIVYPTNSAGATSSGTSEQWVASFSANPTANETVTIGGTSPRQVILVASSTVNTGLNFQFTGNTTTNATNLAAAINRYSSQTGYSATSLAAAVTVIANTATNNSNNSSVVEGLTNFGAFTRTDGTGTTAGQPTMMAFNQMYQGVGGCNGAWNQNGATKAPNVMWSYNTGTGYITETSPTLSYLDGAKQVAYIQRNGTNMQLVLLKWKAGDGSAAVPAIPATAATAANYRAGTGACAGGVACMFAITLNGTTNAGTQGYSPPFVDYAADVLWVGDNNGRLHKFTGVFAGNPAEVTTGGFPATVATGLILSAPVYDFAGNVYVGSQSSVGTEGGKLHRINASTGVVVSSIKLANTTQASTGIRDTPIVTDQPGSGSVFAFLFNDGTAGNGATCDIAANNDNACRVIARFPLNFAAGASPAERSYVGRGNNFNSTLYAGAFDDAYYNTGTGAMYIVGGNVVDTFIPKVWKVPITAGVLQQSIPGADLGPKTCTTVANCITDPKWNWSAVTLVKNGTNEYFFFSMPSSANLGGCTGACLFMFNTANLQNPTSETWQYRFNNNGGNGQTTTGQTFVVGGVTLTSATVNTGLNFKVDGQDRSGDRDSLVAKINSSVPGYTAVATGTSGQFIVTRTAVGNAPPTTVVNNLDQLATQTNTDGIDANLWSTNIVPRAVLSVNGGTGGIAVDNISSTTGASQIYFSHLANGGNAVQASQNGLQ